MTTMTRRLFLCLLGSIVALATFKNRVFAGKDNLRVNEQSPKFPALGVDEDGQSKVFLSRNGSAEENTRKVIESLGGIEALIKPTDIVILKPNGQWWNQGMTNTSSMKAFIELVLGMKNFAGEVIIAENHHFPEVNSRGWTTEHRNGEYNLNELVHYFQSQGFENVTKYHWYDGGPSMPGMWGGAADAGLVNGPEDGDGYHWEKESVYTAPNGRKALMNYPIFTSAHSNIIIDFKNGPWKDGKYLNRNIRFINFSALNSHGSDTGITASIKNYLGVCDMTCGFRGTTPEGYYNFHHIGLSNIHWRLKDLLQKIGWEEHYAAIGGCVGHFMRHVRMADLNIVTAEWAGYGSRTDTQLRAHTKTILASTDPVALDYIAAKQVLLPATKKYSQNKQLERYHDPDNSDSPFYDFLLACHEKGIGNLKEENIDLDEYDFMQDT